MGTTKLPVSEYAGPGGGDPLRLAAMTPKAVEAIGQRTAAELREQADRLEADAKEVADRIRFFADKLEEQSKQASEAVTVFTNKAADVLETIRGLEAKLQAGITTVTTVEIHAEADDGKPIPKFLNGTAGRA